MTQHSQLQAAASVNLSKPGVFTVRRQTHRSSESKYKKYVIKPSTGKMVIMYHVQ
jgi:hypothetical protein